MSPTLAALLGGGVLAAYVPILRAQLRDGNLGIPFGGGNPIRVCRKDNPPLFRLVALGLCAAVALPISACAMIVVRALTT